MLTLLFVINSFNFFQNLKSGSNVSLFKFFFIYPFFSLWYFLLAFFYSYTAIFLNFIYPLFNLVFFILYSKVCFMFCYNFNNKYCNTFRNSSSFIIEFTIIVLLSILISFLAFLSFNFIYSSNFFLNTSFDIFSIVDVKGGQWFWDYNVFYNLSTF